MIQNDLIEEFLERVKDRYTVEELIEVLGLDMDDVLSTFYDDIIESRAIQIECGVQEDNEA